MDVTLRIDDAEVTAPAEAGLLAVARRAGYDIPALCHHEAVPDIAACRLCLVEVRQPLAHRAAAHHVLQLSGGGRPGHRDDSPRVRRHRVMNLQLLLPYAPEAPALQDLAAQLGVTYPLFAPVADAPLPGCILCELCVRVCSSVGYNALSSLVRGDLKSVGPPFGQAGVTDCVGCGSCQSVCLHTVHLNGGHLYHAHHMGPHLRLLHVPALQSPVHDQGPSRCDRRPGRFAGRLLRPLRCLQAGRPQREPRDRRQVRPWRSFAPTCGWRRGSRANFSLGCGTDCIH